MSSVNLSQCHGINPSPDIAGIGVRISVYIQALLHVVCAIIFAKDGRLSLFEGRRLRKTSLNLFVTGCALVVCAFVQAATYGLSVYHGLIVLNLSWITSLSALLYVVIATVDATVDAFSPIKVKNHYLIPSILPVMMSVFHLSCMGALGIWLWATVQSFGDQPECTPITFLTIFGHDVPVTHGLLRHASIGLYSLAVVPFLNMFAIMLASALVAGILSLIYHFFKFTGRCEKWTTFILPCGGLVLLDIIFIVDTELLISRSSKWVKAGESQWTFGQTLALILILGPLFETMKAIFKSWKEENYDVEPELL